LTQYTCSLLCAESAIKSQSVCHPIHVSYPSRIRCRYWRNLLSVHVSVYMLDAPPIHWWQSLEGRLEMTFFVVAMSMVGSQAAEESKQTELQCEYCDVCTSNSVASSYGCCEICTAYSVQSTYIILCT